MWRLLLISVVTAIASNVFAQVPAPEAVKSPTVLVLRFETPGDPEGADWIGRAAQEDLATDLTHNTTAQIKSPFELKPRADLDSALKRARELHATHVVFGQAQSVDGAVRITGQVVDVETGRPLGTLKITGPRSSLFDLEDALTRQVCAFLPQSSLKPDMLRAMQENPPAPAIRLDDPEPTPVQIFPAFASPDYSIPERYESDPAVVINVYASPAAAVSPYASPFYAPYAYGLYPYSSQYLAADAAYSPLGFVLPETSAWYPGYSYPFGWVPFNGGIVVVNNSALGFHHGFGVRHRNGFGAHGRFNNGATGVAAAGNGASVNGGFAANGVTASDPVVFRFNADGGTFFQGIPANGFRPAIPAGGFSVGIPRTGFSTFNGRGPAFRGPAFGNATRGGSAVH